MTLDVIGAGFGRTGTNSLKLALEQLGFGPCHHMFEVRDNPRLVPYWAAAARGQMPDWDELFDGYRSTVDWPSAAFWRELADHYPDAPVILSVRPPEAWFKSVMATIYPSMRDRAGRTPNDRARGDMAWELIVQQTFSGRMDDAAHAMAVFEAHNTEVQRTIAPDRLLTFDVAEGWAPLCRHLGVTVPETPFPRTNSTEQFRSRRVPKDN